MASQTGHIESELIAGLRPGDVLWDTQLKRFGVRCRPRATTYFIKPRIGGRQRWITLGRHGGLTPADARAKAERMLAEIDSGCDPPRERRAPSYTEFFVETHKEMGLGREELESSAPWDRCIVERMEFQSGHTGNAEDLS